MAVNNLDIYHFNLDQFEPLCPVIFWPASQSIKTHWDVIFLQKPELLGGLSVLLVS